MEKTGGLEFLLLGGSEDLSGVVSVDGEEQHAVWLEESVQRGETAVLGDFVEVGKHRSAEDGVGFFGGGIDREARGREIRFAPDDGFGVDIEAVKVEVGISGEQPAEGSTAAVAEIEDLAAGVELGSQVGRDKLGAAFADQEEDGYRERFADAEAEEGRRGWLFGSAEELVVDGATQAEETAENGVVEKPHELA